MKGEALLVLGLLIFTLGLITHFSNLHNVDLSWNAKHLNMVDDNGFVQQDITQMYQQSILLLWATPFIITFGLGIMYVGLKWK